MPKILNKQPQEVTSHPVIKSESNIMLTFFYYIIKSSVINAAAGNLAALTQHT